MSADAHRSEGMVPCYCRTPEPETAAERRARLRGNLSTKVCREILRREGMTYPRTCALCGLGPCPKGRVPESTLAIDNWVQALLNGPIDQFRVDPRVYARAAAVADLVTELRSGPVTTEKLRRLAELVVSEVK